MDVRDQAGEWRRLAEHYRQMNDEELVVLARQNSTLTEVAQQALSQEILHRRLKVQPKEPPAPPPSLDSSHDEDRELVEICTVWSPRDALQLQALLDTAGVPFFMGKERATGVNAVTSNFVNGVSVQVMRIGLPWIREAIENYAPSDEPKPAQEELGELPIRCPKCRSTEIIFERLTPPPTTAGARSASQFEWTCDSCGYQWEDNGVAKV